MAEQVTNSGCFLVSYDISNGKDKCVVVVGTQNKGVVKVINAFEGEEALQLYHKLKGPKK